MKFKDRLTQKPEGNIWKRAFIYLVVLKYIGITSVMFLMFFQLGLIAPDADISETINSTSEKIALVYQNGMTTLFEKGQEVAINNPIMSKVLAFGISHMVWVFYLAIIVLIWDIIRHFIWWLIDKRKKRLDALVSQSTKEEKLE